MRGSESPVRIAVLVSGRGRGTNLQAILDACSDGRIPGRVAVVVSTTPDTAAMERATRAGVPALYVPSAARGPEALLSPEPISFDESLENLLDEAGVGLICLAGFMRKIGPRVLARFRNRIMNVHPSLIPAFAGTGMYGTHVHESVLQYGAKVSGCTVQFINEDYDAGPIILQRAVPVLEDDTPSSLAARVLEQEHAGYVEAIRLFAQGRLRVDGRRVRILDGETE